MGGRKQKGENVDIPHVIITAIIFVALMYWIFLPIWGAMGEVVKALGGR